MVSVLRRFCAFILKKVTRCCVFIANSTTATQPRVFFWWYFCRDEHFLFNGHDAVQCFPHVDFTCPSDMNASVHVSDCRSGFRWRLLNERFQTKDRWPQPPDPTAVQTSWTVKGWRVIHKPLFDSPSVTRHTVTRHGITRTANCH